MALKNRVVIGIGLTLVVDQMLSDYCKHIHMNHTRIAEVAIKGYLKAGMPFVEVPNGRRTVRTIALPNDLIKVKDDLIEKGHVFSRIAEAAIYWFIKERKVET